MLDSFIVPRYSGLVAETAATGRENPTAQRRTSRRNRGYFFVRMPTRAFSYGGPGGASFGWAGFLCGRFLTPAVWPATPHVRMSGGPLSHKGVRYD